MTYEKWERKVRDALKAGDYEKLEDLRDIGERDVFHISSLDVSDEVLVHMLYIAADISLTTKIGFLIWGTRAFINAYLGEE